MKVVQILVDGLGSESASESSGKTPLESAKTPELDRLAGQGVLGLTRCVSKAAGYLDADLLALMGYDPSSVHPGRGRLEALARDVAVAPSDVVLCADVVSFGRREDGTETLVGLAGGGIDPAGGRELGQALAAALSGGSVTLHPMSGTRHVLVWHGGEVRVRTTPPVLLVDQPVAPRLPTGPGADLLRDLMRRGRELLTAHPACDAAARAERPAPNALWLWGEGNAVALPSLAARAGGPATAVATTPRGRALAQLAGLRVVDASAAADPMPYVAAAVAESDLTIVELAPFAGQDRPPAAADRVAVAEALDAQLIGPLLAHLRAQADDWRVLVLCSLTGQPEQAAPFVVGVRQDESRPRRDRRFHERDAREQGIFIPEAHTLMERMLRR